MKIGWSKFAIKQNSKKNHSYFKGSRAKLLELVRLNWKSRKPGQGRDGLSNILVY
jgi:hypothetical protein